MNNQYDQTDRAIRRACAFEILSATGIALGICPLGFLLGSLFVAGGFDMLALETSACLGVICLITTIIGYRGLSKDNGANRSLGIVGLIIGVVVILIYACLALWIFYGLTH